jgi:hypothetical protein
MQYEKKFCVYAEPPQSSSDTQVTHLRAWCLGGGGNEMPTLGPNPRGAHAHARVPGEKLNFDVARPLKAA